MSLGLVGCEAPCPLLAFQGGLIYLQSLQCSSLGPVKGIDYLQGRATIRGRLGNPNCVDFGLKAAGIGTIALTRAVINMQKKP